MVVVFSLAMHRTENKCGNLVECVITTTCVVYGASCHTSEGTHLIVASSHIINQTTNQKTDHIIIFKLRHYLLIFIQFQMYISILLPIH